MNKENTITECTWCGNDLADDDIVSSYRDEDGDIMCSDCYHDEYSFTCAKCENYGETKEMGNIGSLLIVVDQAEAEVPVGTYRITKHPYYGSDYFSMWLYEHALERVSSDTFGVNDDYAVGHLCYGCQKRVEALLQTEPASQTSGR